MRIQGACAKILSLLRPHKSKTFASTLTQIRRMPHSAQIVVLIEANIFLREKWQNTMKDATVIAFRHPEYFLVAIREIPGFIERVACVITDRHFDWPDLDGRPIPPLILTTFDDHLDHESGGMIISKEPTTWREIDKVLSKMS